MDWVVILVKNCVKADIVTLVKVIIFKEILTLFMRAKPMVA